MLRSNLYFAFISEEEFHWIQNCVLICTFSLWQFKDVIPLFCFCWEIRCHPSRCFPECNVYFSLIALRLFYIHLNVINLGVWCSFFFLKNVSCRSFWVSWVHELFFIKLGQFLLLFLQVHFLLQLFSSLFLGLSLNIYWTWFCPSG